MDTDERKPEHSILTFTGTRFWPLQPRPEEVNILDIAHSLSNQGRFTGHTREFYSVAQHSVLCSRFVASEFALWALLHDATEAYLIDMASPVKMQMPEFRWAEARLMEAVAVAFNLPLPLPEEVHRIDRVLLVTEKRDLMGKAEFSSIHTGGVEPLSMTIEPWLPKVAKQAFLSRYRELTGPIPAQFACGIEGCCGFERDLAEESLIQIADDFANRETV